MLSKFNKIVIDCLNHLSDKDFIRKYGYSWFFNFILFYIINSFIGGVHYD